MGINQSKETLCESCGKANFYVDFKVILTLHNEDIHRAIHHRVCGMHALPCITYEVAPAMATRNPNISMPIPIRTRGIGINQMKNIVQKKGL